MMALCLLTTSPLLCADMSAKDYTDEFYKEFSQPPDDGTMSLIVRFHHEVPASLQAEVLDQMLDRAISTTPQKAYFAIGVVCMYLRNHGSDLIVNGALEANLYALAKDSNWITRRDVLQVLSSLKRDKDHDLIVAALSDPKDEVRAAAMNALRDRPDAEATFQKFIQDHRPLFRGWLPDRFLLAALT